MKIFKKKKKDEGFTLIEVLGTIVILGIVLGVSVPLVSRAVKKSQLKQMETQEQTLSLVGKNYFLDNRDELPEVVNDKEIVAVSNLVLNGYVKEVKDYNNTICDLVNSYVEVTKTDKGEYDYHTYLYCDGYETGDAWTEWVYVDELPDLSAYPPVEVETIAVYNYSIETGEIAYGDPSDPQLDPFPVEENYIYDEEIRYNYKTVTQEWSDYVEDTTWSTAAIGTLPGDTATEMYKYDYKYQSLIGYRWYRWARTCRTQHDVTTSYTASNYMSCPECPSTYYTGGYTWYNFAQMSCSSSSYPIYTRVCYYGRNYYTYATYYNTSCPSGTVQTSSWRDYKDGYYLSYPSGYPYKNVDLVSYGSAIMTGETLPTGSNILISWRHLVSNHETITSGEWLSLYITQAALEQLLGDTLENLEVDAGYVILNPLMYWRTSFEDLRVVTVQLPEDKWYDIDEFIAEYNTLEGSSITLLTEVEENVGYTLIEDVIYKYKQRKY